MDRWIDAWEDGCLDRKERRMEGRDGGREERWGKKSMHKGPEIGDCAAS